MANNKLLNENELIRQIAIVTIAYKDHKLKCLSPDAPKILRKCADRIEEVQKDKSLKEGETL